MHAYVAQSLLCIQLRLGSQAAKANRPRDGHPAGRAADAFQAETSAKVYVYVWVGLWAIECHRSRSGCVIGVTGHATSTAGTKRVTLHCKHCTVSPSAANLLNCAGSWAARAGIIGTRIEPAGPGPAAALLTGLATAFPSLHRALCGSQASPASCLFPPSPASRGTVGWNSCSGRGPGVLG